MNQKVTKKVILVGVRKFWENFNFLGVAKNVLPQRGVGNRGDVTPWE